MEFVTILLICLCSFWLGSMWDLRSQTRDGTHTPCTGRQTFNHWPTREVPKHLIRKAVIKTILKNIQMFTLDTNYKSSVVQVSSVSQP